MWGSKGALIGASCCSSGKKWQDWRRLAFLVGLVNGAGADYGAENPRLGKLRGGDLGKVIRKDDEIGVLASLQLALLPFLELRVSRTGGVRADTILERDFFLRLPAVFRAAIGAFARDAGVQAAKRTDGLDVVIGAKRQARAAFQQGGPSISAQDALAADAILGRAHVGGLMRRLHA